MNDAQHFDALLQAYRAALYEVAVHGQMHVIRVDEPLPNAIEALLAANGVSDAAFLSAANPFSKPCDAAQNARCHAALLETLSDLGVHWLAASGRDARGEWPSEPSVLALGIDRRQALRVAEQFGQNAYVEVVAGAPARLLLSAHWRQQLD